MRKVVMVLCKSHCLLFAIVSACALSHTRATRSWDLGITIGQEVEFFAMNGTSTGTVKIASAVSLTEFAYDDVTRTAFLTDSQDPNAFIISNNLTDQNTKVKSILKNGQSSYITGMAFDPLSRTLFWSDIGQHAILKMNILQNGTFKSPQILHDLEYKIPRGVTLDICNRHIYWTNSNSSNPSIERSNLDGSNRTVVISSDLYKPMSAAVDHITRKLYWCDDSEGNYFKIERSNLDGSNREVLVNGVDHAPVDLAVDRESVYWIDFASNAIWTIKKDKRTSGNAPKEFRSYYNNDNKDARILSIVTRDNIGSIDCDTITELDKRKTHSPGYEDAESFNNLTTSTEEVASLTNVRKTCLNGGRYNELDDTCHCLPGFDGQLCDTSFCHNYCLRGTCVINKFGQPKCNCGGTYSGERCEKNVCENYCLHGGQCIVEDEKPLCRCTGYRGARCESANVTDEIDAKLYAGENSASSANDTSSCGCPKTDQSLDRVMNYDDNFDHNILLPILAALIGVLTVLVAVLSYHISKLRRRPRIKKRFVVSKGGVTPLTSRPQLPSDQCEITIENCCNMNICETPCFEPKLRGAPTKPSKGNGTRKEEKNSLLDSMEGDSC